MTSQRHTYTTRDRALVTTEHYSETHYEEFSKVVDSLGRVWDALKHPRDHLGRFIRTFSNVKFNMPGEHGVGTEYSGTVLGVDQDGTLQAEITGVPGIARPGGPSVGEVVRLNNNDVEVQTIKAQLSGKGAAGKLNDNELTPLNNAVENLDRLGLEKESKELAEIRDIAMEEPNPKDPASQARKDSAIERFRLLAEKLDNVRGEGFDEGTNLDDVRADLTAEERDRLDTLGKVIDVTFTARHSLGDKTIDASDSEGVVKAKRPEVRIGIGQSKIQQNYDTGKKMWDATGATLTESQLAQPEAVAVVDTARPDAAPDPNIYSALIRSSYAKVRSGLNRVAGYKQAQRVAPGARFHVDKNGDEVIPGATVVLDANAAKGRPEEVLGMVQRIAYDKQSQKTTMVVREYDPEYKYGNKNSKGKPLPYIDRRGVSSTTITLADDEHQNTMFTNLALQGKTKIIDQMTSMLAEDQIAKLQAEAGRRYAEAGAKRTSPTGAIDAIPIHARRKMDANGEWIGPGDHAIGPNGEVGIITYMEPNTNTTRIMYPNGQLSPRWAASAFQKAHGPSSEVYPGSGGFGDSAYVPTREEAAADADSIGATQVAEVIRSGGDGTAIQTAYGADPAFQENVVAKADDLYDREAQALSTGGEPTEEDKAELAMFSRFAAASLGQFREPDAPPPEPPAAPEPEEDGETPQNPANPEQEVTEGGVTVREADEGIVVDENVESPVESTDTEAVDQAVEQAEAEKAQQQPEGPEQPPEQATLAEKIRGDVTRLVEEAKNAPNVKPTQRQQLDKWLGELNAAIDDQDGPGVVNALQGMTKAVNLGVNRPQLGNTRLRAVLNRANAKGDPLHAVVQQRLDAGDDIFSGRPLQRTERPAEPVNEVPEGVDPQVDATNNAMSEALLLDDGSTLVLDGDEELSEGFYVIDPDTVTEVDEITDEAVTDFLESTQGSENTAFSVWFNEADGKYRMARVGIYETEEEAAGAAEAGGSNQYVNIADGSVMNIAIGGDPDLPPEAIEDPRSEERHVRTPGAGRASASTTAKQKSLLEHVGSTGGDEEIARISQAVANGEEISGADASRLADAIDAMDAGAFDKPADKGLASQLAHKLARATGEEGARGYSSQATALSRGSSVGISLTAQSQSDDIRSLVDRAKDDVKNGDMGEAAKKFRDAADAFDALSSGGEQVPAERAREHAARLDAMGGTTGPAPAQAPEAETPEAPAAPEAEQAQPGTAREALDAAGMPEVEPLTQSQFSNPDTPRTRQVTPQEYSALALRGRDRLTGMLDDSAAPDALEGQTWDEVKRQAWDSVQEEWGGITVDAHTGQAVTGEDDAYALTFRPPGTETVSVPIGSSQEDFDAAMEQALTRFGGEEDSPLWAQQAHLGVFRNDDTGNYEIDPVLVLDNLDDVEAIGAYSGSEGGAYNFKDGLGYWPPYVAEEEAGGGAGEEGVPGARRLESPSPEGGEAEPGVPPEEQAEGPAGSAGGGPEALEVGASPTETLENLFDRIGQPADYGTEHQGRMLGEARSLATEGLTGEAADRLEIAAAAAPEGSDEKRLMLEAATALRGGEGGGESGAPAPTGRLEVGQRVSTEYGDGRVTSSTGRSVTVELDNGETINVQTGTPGYGRITPIEETAPGAGAPSAQEVESVLSAVENAIDSEEQAEGDNGPQGMTPELEDASAKLGLIQGRVTAEGPYTELSQDLRELATWIEDHWRLTDPGPLLDELRSTADGLEATTNAGAPASAAPTS